MLIDATFVDGTGSISASGGAGQVRVLYAKRGCAEMCWTQAGMVSSGAGAGGRVAFVNFVNASLTARVLPGASVDPLMAAGVGTIYRRARDRLQEDVLLIALPDSAPLTFLTSRAAGTRIEPRRRSRSYATRCLQACRGRVR